MSEPTKGTRVTCTDLETGESETTVLVNDYAVVTDGRMAVDTVQTYGNGTVQITIKRSAA